jgi:hypothetical protein
MFALPTTFRLRQRLYFINISIKAIQRSVRKNLSVQIKTIPLSLEKTHGSGKALSCHFAGSHGGSL